MNNVTKVYLAAAAGSTGMLIFLREGLVYAGYTAAASGLMAVYAAIAGIALMTGVLFAASVLRASAGARHITAAVLLPVATAAAGTCLATARATGQPLFLVLGTFIGIAYGVTALRYEIDDVVSYRMLLAVVFVQAATPFFFFN